MRQPILLKIDHPCSQDWHLMQNNEQGKYCVSCQKNVIDFTLMSNQEIINVLEKQKGRICGRLRHDQINQFLLQTINRKWSLVTFNALAGLLLFKSFDAKSKEVTRVIQTTSLHKNIIEPKPESRTDAVDKDSVRNIVRGKVLDSQTKESLIGAQIAIKGATVHVTADIDGKFALPIPDSLINGKIELEVRYVGYNSTVFTISKSDIGSNKELLIKAKAAVLGEVVVIRKKKWWQKLF